MNAKRASSVRDGVGGMHHRGFVTCVVAAAWLTTGLLPGAVVASDDPGPAWHKEATTLKYDRADARDMVVCGVEDLEYEFSGNREVAAGSGSLLTA